MTRATSVAKLVWALLSVAALAFHIYVVLFTEAADSHVVFGWAMMILTFPLGLIPLFAYGAVAQAAGQPSDLLGFIGLALLWFAMTVIGFFQWFWLVPRAVRLVRVAAASER